MFKTNIKFPLLSIFMLFNLSACAVYNTDMDREIGAENSQKIAQQMGLYQPQALSEYVQSVGQRLVAELDNPEFTFQFEIVDDPVPNAFALPGGYIYISRGLLALMISEDELANVLAHEIIHVTERHSVKQMRSGILPGLIELPGNIVGGIVSEDLGNLINAPISAGNDLILSGYGRGHETESDDKGVALATKAGYRPHQMTDILVRLNSAVELSTQQKQEKSYFDSHPYTPDRVANIDDIVSTLTVSPKTSISPDFMQTLDGLLYGENPAKGVFIEQQFLHPDMGFVIDFPKKWETLNQPTAVVAFDKKQQAFVALTTVSNKKNALKNAQEFQKQVKKQTGKQVDYKTITFDWGGTGYLVNLEDNRQKEITTIEILWVDLNGLTYQVSSMAKNNLKAHAHKSSLSLRPILATETNAILKQVIKTVPAMKNDTLETLAKREKNIGDINYLALINEVTETETLTTGKSIKIIVNKVYKTPLIKQ